MFIDLTLEVTPKLTQDAKGNESKANFGHLGTHFDVMNNCLLYTSIPLFLFIKEK